MTPWNLPAWLAGALMLMALGPGSAGAGNLEPRLQLAQLAANGAPGIVTTVAFGDLPDGQPVAVTPFADDDLSLSVKARFEVALRAAGRPVSDSAPLTLSFDTKMIEGRWSRAEANLGRIEANDADAQLNLNIWSSSQDSLLGGRQKAGAPSHKVNLFHMNVVLHDRETGKTLWQGDAYCEMLTADQARIAGSMVAPLIASLGRSVTGQPFDIE
jgi:hypothetical protein